MTELLIIKIVRESLMTVMLVAAPVLGVGMLVGLVVSIFQTTTSIQEQTLTFVPKMLAIFITIILFGSWMIRVLINYTNNIFALIEKVGGG
ncbi:MAG: flagellar biosynthesis protein FliQ [Leptospirales bacterium]|nr:flagellar biosynthesis protein FliQ [Leptospirales bacterium]